MIHWMADRFHSLRPAAYQLVLLASSALSVILWLGLVACIVALLAELAFSLGASPAPHSEP
jgi:hypothetical protein